MSELNHELLSEYGIPATLQIQRPTASLDNVPNRFVKFALQEWLNVVEAVADTIVARSSATELRKHLETQRLGDTLRAILSDRLFKEVSDVPGIPVENQVLQKRDGYRDVLGTFVLCDAASKLTWKGGLDVYGAGQRNVAVLYEYWVFLQVAQAVATKCGASFDWSGLFTKSANGLDLMLKRRQSACVSGIVMAFGRRIRMELFYNRTFSSRHDSGGSRSRDMRPDCSLRLWPVDADRPVDDVWIHFDAKYKVELLHQILSASDLSVDEEEPRSVEKETHRSATREDLLKMHAYRDAIRRSAGAYVIYPGDKSVQLQEYHELLPGLGAFALRPADSGSARGLSALELFLSDVISHVATQSSQHERARYWEKEVHSQMATIQGSPSASFLRRPPADTSLLLGYTHDDRHMEWVQRNFRYNIRAADRSGAVSLNSAALSAELLLLYSPKTAKVELWRVAHEPEIWTKARMKASGYPDARGELYFCFVLGENITSSLDGTYSAAIVMRARDELAKGGLLGAPVCVSWADFGDAVNRFRRGEFDGATN